MTDLVSNSRIDRKEAFDMRTAYYNAKVYTGTLPLAEAFIVEDDRFFAVGTSAEILTQMQQGEVEF